MHILFDIGKTKTRMARSEDLASFGKPKIFDTRKEYNNFLNNFKNVVDEISSQENKVGNIESAGGGVGMPIDKKTGVLSGHPEFSDWEGKPLKDDLEKIFHAPVILENDSAVVGVGEAVHGAGREFSLVAYISVSTGVGGARIIDGKIDANALGFEPGWQVLTIAGDRMYAEEFLGGKSIEKMTGKHPREIVNADFWEQEAKILARFLNNIIVMWSPDVVVLGGSMMNEIGIPISATKKYLKEVCKIFPTLPPLKHSQLGDLGGLWGAMEILKDGK